MISFLNKKYQNIAIETYSQETTQSRSWTTNSVLVRIVVVVVITIVAHGEEIKEKKIK
jgi:hypothetical protein